MFHFAAISTTRETASDIERSERVNVASVETLIDWAKRDAPKARVLTMSSAAIFGESTGQLNEETPTAPVDEYGRQKLRVRELALKRAVQGCTLPARYVQMRARAAMSILSPRYAGRGQMLAENCRHCSAPERSATGLAANTARRCGVMESRSA